MVTSESAQPNLPTAPGSRNGDNFDSFLENSFLQNSLFARHLCQEQNKNQKVRRKYPKKGQKLHDKLFCLFFGCRNSFSFLRLKLWVNMRER